MMIMIALPGLEVSSALKSAACTASAQFTHLWTWVNITAATISPRTVQLWGITTAIAVPNKMEGN
jgi:hypothetical protein